MDGEDSPSKGMQCKEDTRQKPSPSPRVRQRQKVQKQPDEEAGVVEEPVSISSDLAHFIKLSAKDLKLRQTDRRWAAELVNDFRENLLKFLKSNNDQPFFQSVDVLTTGSYFENVKINNPDEFDIMLKIQTTTRFQTEPLDDGLFYQINLSRPTRTHIQDFLLENNVTLSSSQVLTEMHRLVRKFLKTYEVPDKSCRWEMNRKRIYSPAVTLSLCRNNSAELISVDVVPALEVPAWPAAVRNGPEVDNWLGKKVRQEFKSFPCFFVPKRQKGKNLKEEAKESWRISFSHIEKKIIMCHGNKKTCCEKRDTKCCRKSCLMLLKSLIASLKIRFPKELEDLCSYHGKTTFLHTLASRFKDSMWAPQDLPVCFLHLICALEGHARSGVLPHFFVPECNLFSKNNIARKTLAFLAKALEEQRREGLPLLKPQAPVPPLKPETISPEIFTDKSSLVTAGPSVGTTSWAAIKPTQVFAVCLVCVLIFYMAIS
ncbi:cyclic GMP-AMP synthase [Mugil cephalus]|uniref:cyclic GMP-AMP synthase n=1 Tax=Mugil cephalus TaxID=48193 RepID=UPI001FB6ACF2|nr:cyclic GMP-AMP synthase [Mugil cephalus]